MLDGTIDNSWAAGIGLVTWLVGANVVEARRNPMPPRERYRLDGRQPWVAFWNLFDATVFTPEAIEFHRRRLKWIPVSFGTLAALWIVLDTIW